MRRIGKRDEYPDPDQPLPNENHSQSQSSQSNPQKLPPISEPLLSRPTYTEPTWGDPFQLSENRGRQTTEDRIQADLKLSPSYVPHFSTSNGGVIVSAQLPHDLVRMMDIIAVDPRLPMRTRTDIVREAVYHYLQALVRAYEIDDARLRELLAAEDLMNLMADMREKQDRLHNIATSLRNHLNVRLASGDIHLAMIDLRRFYDSCAKLSPEERDSYLGLIKTVPIFRYVAFFMTDWNDRIPDASLIPEFKPSDDGFMSDDGIPPMATVKVTQERRDYMREYMRTRRSNEKSGVISDGNDPDANNVTWTGD